ncbi:MAG: MBL fold metallo-hydrolase [Polyangiales bacterium]
MKVTLWGTRGSLASPGPETARYGGNTVSVEVWSDDGHVLVLDAGTGARRLGGSLVGRAKRVDLLITHLHMDHIQGLGFFAPLYTPGLEVHLWGPASATMGLRTRLGRYMSPPLFPVRLRDLPCDLTVHEVPCGTFHIGPYTIDASLICHPGPTVGYRVNAGKASLAYLPDHEPALGLRGPLLGGGWTSGLGLARGAGLLVHDAQYSDEEYVTRVGWGHSTLARTMEFAALAGAEQLVLFHHDPSHDDAALDAMTKRAVEAVRPAMPVCTGAEGDCFVLDER